jgi:cytochrome P450
MVDLFTPSGDELHVALRTAAENGPIVGEPSTGATVVLRYKDVEALARDPRLKGVGLSFFDLMGIADGPLRDWYGGLMFTTEGEHHDRLRKLVSRAFTPRSVEALRPVAAAMTHGRLGPLVEAGGGDLADAFSLLAMRLMCRLLGVPEADVEVFGAWADALSPIFGFMDADQIYAATTALKDLLGYVDALAAKRRGAPADDLITALLDAESDGDKLTHDELVAMVANLLVGGHDTTTSQLACSLLTILRHPPEAERLRADPSLFSSAVEESIRFEPSIVGVPRTVIEPLDVGGTHLGAGSVVVLCTASANREPRTWEDPDRFDVARFAQRGGRGLLSFGAGPHYCLGAALARLTVQECVRGVLDCGADVRLDADPADIPWRQVLGRAPARLPVVAA